MSNKVNIGFIGAGGIARPHAFALNSIRYYYSDFPEIRLAAVSSFTEKKRDAFAASFGFEKALSPDDFFASGEIDTVYILGPNKVHYEHLRRAVSIKSVKRIYIEKPLCSTPEEEEGIRGIVKAHPEIKFQIGFQFLFMTAIREALRMWKTGIFGRPFHFDFRYFHGDYLQKSYRDKRANRLTPAPDGGAMADLGSHAISLLVAFLGNELKINDATQSGKFEDVDPFSDLFSLLTVTDMKTGAAGTISASRIAAGTGDLLSLELYAEKGAIRFTSYDPDNLEYYLEETGAWTKIHSGSSYGNITNFPSGHVPPGWLRPMIHAHYVFLGGNDPQAFIPDIDHGLEVQKIVRETAVILRGKEQKRI
ncbi:MAG TPA: Gfo/Idh/MocA family oxidoreductase [Bacteroidales bacterium]|nr:Gfo/Idh/MocA family oxidoreductase [Bacteroidales bacterium]